MKIAIFASTSGEKALFLHDFFKEGNRITVEILYTDNLQSPVAARIQAEGIQVEEILPDVSGAAIVDNLRALGVELLVVDGYQGYFPDYLKDVYANRIVYPTSAESAPLEVIEAIDRINASAKVQAEPKQEQPKSQEETPQPAPASNRTPLEQEWAEVLDIDNQEPASEPQEQPAAETAGEQSAEAQPPEPEPQQPPQPEPPQPPLPPNQQTYGQYQQPYQQPYQQYQQPYPQPPQSPYNQSGYDRPQEPMPNTYLAWSVIITVLCCLIPGVIAIIYSASVSSKYYRGDIEGAKRASRMAEIWCIVSIIAGIVWGTLYIPLTLLGF